MFVEGKFILSEVKNSGSKSVCCKGRRAACMNAKWGGGISTSIDPYALIFKGRSNKILNIKEGSKSRFKTLTYITHHLDNCT